MWGLWLSFTESPDFHLSTNALRGNVIFTQLESQRLIHIGAYVNEYTSQLAIRIVNCFDAHRCAQTLVKVLIEEEIESCGRFRFFSIKS